VDQAAAELSRFLTPTPLQHSRAFSEAAGCEVHLKLESAQPIRAFKVRGALNKIARLTSEQRAAGVITASAGNHGLGVAFAASKAHVHAIVVVPEGANQLKVEAIRRLGAEVLSAGENYAAAQVKALEVQRASGGTMIHAYDDPDVVAGQGTIAIELLRDMAHFDTAVVPIGGGGLIGGIALYLKAKLPGVRVIGAEPAGADGMLRSLEAGEVVTLDRVSTIADGLAASAPSTLTLELARRHVDEIHRVDEVEMLRVIRLLFEWEHLLAEPAGAAALAALLYHHKPRPAERVVVLLSGANVTESVLLRALETR